MTRCIEKQIQEPTAEESSSVNFIDTYYTRFQYYVHRRHLRLADQKTLREDKITITSVQCTSTIVLSIIGLLSIKGLSFRKT